MEKLSESEEIVMQSIWESSAPVSLSEIIRWCQAHGHPWKSQTVSTFLVRLSQKGYVGYEQPGRNRRYLPRISRENYLNNQMCSMLDFWGKPSIDALASAFRRAEFISRNDLKELREMLDDMDE